MRRPVAIICLVALALSTPLVARQGPAPPTDWTATTAALERAVLEDDTDGLIKLRAQLLRMIAAQSGDERVQTQYAVAYVGWRLSFNPATSGRAQSDYLDEAEAQLKAALKTSPKHAEALGLLSSIYGAKIAKSPISGIILGPRSSGAIDDALAIEPDNPRLLLTKGVGKFHTPSAFGGSVKEAERLIRRALQVFQTEPPDKPWPNWGRFDAHAWLGQVLAKSKNTAGARAEYDEALKIAPKSGWVRYVLLPALDK